MFHPQLRKNHYLCAIIKQPKIMQQIDFNTVQQFNDYYGFETLHPLVSVV